MSLTGTTSAQLEILPLEEMAAEPRGEGSGLRAEAAARLAAHRRRRGRAAEEAGETPATAPAKRHRAATLVAERYAQTPSYRAFLAEEARRATERAAAAAQVAQRNAEAVAAVQQELLAELDLWVQPQAFTPETAVVQVPVESPMVQPVQPVQPGPGGLTVRLYEDVGVAVPAAARPVRAQGTVDEAEARVLDEEIAFRQAPVFESFGAGAGAGFARGFEDFHGEFFHVEPAEPLPANLLEFPRQLVAPRKARPRLAEGPLLEESVAHTPQLRIFEVTPEQITAAPAVSSAAPEWSGLYLEAHAAAPHPEPDEAAMLLPSLVPPQTAPLELRLMAAAVDGLLVLTGLVAFAGVAVEVAGVVPAGVQAATMGLPVLVLLYVLYQLLFFTLSDQTPGMRYARLGLCTLTDENPTRAAMRRRLLAKAVSFCPLGLGFVWVLFDDERLGWHDRLARMYQRAY